MDARCRGFAAHQICWWQHIRDLHTACTWAPIYIFFLQRKGPVLLPGKCRRLPAPPLRRHSTPPGVCWGRWGEVVCFFIFFPPFNEKNVFLSRRLSLKNTALGRKAAGSVTFTSAGPRLMCSPREPALCQPHCPQPRREEQGQSRGSQGKPQIPTQSKTLLLGFNSRWGCMGLLCHPAEVFGPFPGKTRPDCRSHVHPWLLHGLGTREAKKSLLYSLIGLGAGVWP